MVHLTEPEDNIIEAAYIAPCPASLFSDAQMMPGDTFHRLLNEGCLEDKLIATGSSLKQENGFRTIAIFSKIRHPHSKNDFHCAFLNERNNWEEKVISEEAKEFKMIAQIEQFSGYKFLGFYLSPKNPNLKCLKNIAFDKRTINCGAESTDILVVDPKHTNGGSWAEPITFFLDLNVAYLNKYDYVVPLPALP